MHIVESHSVSDDHFTCINITHFVNESSELSIVQTDNVKVNHIANPMIILYFKNECLLFWIHVE